MILKTRYLRFIFILILAAWGCGQNDSSPGDGAPRANRLVSLSPSITRMIIDLGEERRLAGVTSFHPPLTRKIPVIGTLVNPSVEAILQARPDVVLLSEEDGATQKSDILRATGLRLMVLGRHKNFNNIRENYLKIASLLGQEEKGRKKTAAFQGRLAALRASVTAEKEVIFLVATRPLVTVSAASFISAMIKDGGGRNSFDHLTGAYPVITLEALIRRDPPVLIVMEKGGKKKLQGLLKGFPVRALKKRNIFEISPDSVAYYTPDDYIKGAVAIRTILSAAR